MSGRQKLAMPQVGAIRYDYHGPMRVMAAAEGWLLIRRYQAGTVALSVKDWMKLSESDAVVGKSSAPRFMGGYVLT